MSPFRLRYGDRAAAYTSLASMDLQCTTTTSAASLIQDINDSIQVVQQIAIFLLDAEMMALATKFPIASEDIKPGDYILAEHHPVFNTKKVRGKLTPRWRGPYKVVTKVVNHITAVHCGTNKVEELDILTVKAFNMTSEDDIALAIRYDVLDYSVFDILHHEGIDITDLMFEVKFPDNDEPSWVPFAFVVDHKDFKAYCKTHQIILVDPKTLTGKKKGKKILSVSSPTVVPSSVVPVESPSESPGAGSSFESSSSSSSSSSQSHVEKVIVSDKNSNRRHPSPPVVDKRIASSKLISSAKKSGSTAKTISGVSRASVSVGSPVKIDFEVFPSSPSSSRRSTRSRKTTMKDDLFRWG